MIILLAWVWIGSTACLAQGKFIQFYTFKKDTAAFHLMDTSKMHSINHGDTWVEDDEWTVPLGFTFRFLNHDVTEIRINQSNILFPNRNYYFNPFGLMIMGDRGDSIRGSLSPIAYVLDSLNGKKIMKLQWINAGFQFDTATYANLQVWLYEGSNMIEARYGSSYVNVNHFQEYGCGPFVGLASVEDTITQKENYIYCLSGNASQPDTATLKDSLTRKWCLNIPKNDTLYASNIIPAGTVYRFYFNERSGIAPENSESSIQIYPNPATDNIRIEFRDENKMFLELTDMMGKVYYTAQIYSGTRISLHELPNGIYICKLRGNNTQYAGKIILNKP